MPMALLTSLAPFLQPTFTNPSQALLFTLLLREGVSVFSHYRLTQCNVTVAFIHNPLFVCVEIAMRLGQPVDPSNFFRSIAACHLSKLFLPSSPLK